MPHRFLSSPVCHHPCCHQNLDYIEATKELKAGDIDAFFCTAGLTTTVIDELSKECDIRLIPLTDTVISKMLESSSAYTSEVIPAGTYTGQTTDISTIGCKISAYHKV